MTTAVVRSFRASVVCLALALAVVPPSDPSSAQQAQQPPFRTATNLVRVDAYPSKDGRIQEGLARDDFEILEDGVPQKIETFEYIAYPQSNPVEDRRDPNSQREGFQLAADPTYRVFAIYLDNLHVQFAGSHNIRMPLVTFLNRVLGPRDLFGVLTTIQEPRELMLGQQTQFIEEQLTRYWFWGQGAIMPEDEQDMMLEACFGDGPLGKELVRRRRLNEVFNDLEGLVALLGNLREERKNVLLVTDGWVITGRAPELREAVKPRMPSVGVTNAGKLTMGRRGSPNEFDPRYCEDSLQLLSDIDFRTRMQDLVKFARQSNVTFYAIRTAGLVASASLFEQRLDTAGVDSLLTLSHNTDGIAVANTNDLSAGVRRIADDLSGMYLLGYYPTNAKPDGRVRRITVRLKSTGETVRARREYRAPSERDIAAMREATAAAAAAPTASDEALAELKRLRPGAAVHSRASIVGDEVLLVTELTAPEIEAGRWKEGAELQVVLSGPGGEVMTTSRGKLEAGLRAAVVRMPLDGAPGPFNLTIRLRSDIEGTTQDGVSIARPAGLFGDPLVYRYATPTSPRLAGSVQFRRTERIQVRWPLGGALTKPEARLLGRDGVPIEVPVTAEEQEIDGVRYLVADLRLAPLTAGEYILRASDASPESTAAHLAFRVTR